MWSEVNKLSRQSLSQSQIALSLGISRDILESEQTLRTFFGQWEDDSLLSRFLSSPYPLTLSAAGTQILTADLFMMLGITLLYLQD